MENFDPREKKGIKGNQAVELNEILKTTKDTAIDPSEEVLSGRSGGTPREMNQEEIKKVEEGRIQGIKGDLEAKFKVAETSETATEMQGASVELPEGVPAIFAKFPGILSKVEELVNKTTGKDQKGFKAVTNFFTKGLNKDTLEILEKGAKSIYNGKRMDMYQRALDKVGVERAWDFIEQSGTNNFLNVDKDGNIVKNSITRGKEFSGSIEKTENQ